jgi:hypothetical protein
MDAELPESADASSTIEPLPDIDETAPSAPTATKKRGGRVMSGIWALFTDNDNPQTFRSPTCKHCKQGVVHHKKSEIAKRHLQKCKSFQSYMMTLDFRERPEWFNSKRASTNSSVSGQRSISEFLLPQVSPKTKKKFHERIALHYYLTGTSFQRIEEPTLASALQLLRPDHGLLPSRKSLAGVLLDKAFERVKKESELSLSDKAIYFCLATDGWSNVRNEPIINYIALSPMRSLFLESVSTGEQGHNSDFIANDILRVMAKFSETQFSGATTDNTSANRSAWTQLKTKLPGLFFQGCMSHGLHLLVKDIFAATKTRRHGHGVEAQYPDGYPFDYLLEFANDCKDVVKFFYNHHAVKAALTKMQKSAGVIALVKPAPTR